MEGFLAVGAMMGYVAAPEIYAKQKNFPSVWISGQMGSGKSTFCSLLLPEIGVRHIILKDTQILPDGSQQTQEDPAFSDPKPDPGEGQQLGITAGADTTNMGGRNYKRGNWYFTGERSVSC